MASSTRRSSGPVLRSISPSGRFASTSAALSPAFMSAPSSLSSSFYDRSASPTRVNLIGSASSAASVRFSVTQRRPASSSASRKKTCMCSPTNHPGSFRCSLHKGMQNPSNQHNRSSVSAPSTRLNARRSAMANSLVRIGSVEGGDWEKRALAALIRPSSHQQRRRADFRPRPSRLSVMSLLDGS